MNTLARFGLVSALSLGTLTAAATSAHAQVSVMMTRSIGDGPGAGAIAKRNIDTYAEMLSLSAEQKETAITVHEGYMAAYRQARDEQRKAIDELRRAAEDTDDHSVFMEKMPAVEKEFRTKSEALEKSLFADLRAMLTSEQDEKWGSVERARRREIGLRGAMRSGESVDLIEVVRGLKLQEESMAVVNPLLADYEIELDRALTEKAAAAPDEMGFTPGQPLDMEKIQAAMKVQGEAAQRVVDVNDRNARKIEAVLQDDARIAFRDSVRRATFPRVYREPRIIKQIDGALALSDLDAPQREQLTQLKESYLRDAKPLNDAWASAVQDSEKSGENGMVGGGGMRIMLQMGDEPSALNDARKARRQLDDRTSERLKSVLKPNQFERLPKSAEEGDGEAMVGGGRMIIREEER